MSDHTSALVPIESWCFCSPELRANNKLIDIGLLAESLLYYDCVFLNVSNQPQFAELLNWFVQQDKYSDFLALIKDGVIKIYDYAFITAAIEKEGTYSIWNVQDTIQAEPNTFERRILYHNLVQACLKNARQREKLYKALRGNVIEVKSNEFGKTIENARHDYNNPQRNALIVQAFVDELYHFRKLGRPPDINAIVTAAPDGSRMTITWNVNFDELSKIAGKQLNFHRGTTLTAGAITNRFLWSAASLECDLYLGQPISVLIGDKLYESGKQIIKGQKILEELQGKVDFPDIRQLVNAGDIKLEDILKIRKKARRFRDWLQNETDRDRDAIIAYHHEVAKEAGFTKLSRKALSLFGVIGGGALGSALGSALSGPAGAAMGGAAGGAATYILDIASKLGGDWKPVIFGNWLRSRIEKVLDENNRA